MPVKRLTSKKCGLSFLKILLRLKPQERSCLIDHLNESSINKIGHLVFNSIFTDLKLSSKRKNHLAQHLKPHKKDLFYIANANHPVESRRKRVKKQSASGLGILLASVVPALVSLLAK